MVLFDFDSSIWIKNIDNLTFEVVFGEIPRLESQFWYK